MQVMPNTATWMNQRFGTSFGVHTLSGNAFLGGQYLAWLVAYSVRSTSTANTSSTTRSTGAVLK